MTILEMITEWRKGCSCGAHNPSNCPDCTTALIDAIERKLVKEKRKVYFGPSDRQHYDIARCYDDAVKIAEGMLKQTSATPFFISHHANPKR